MLTADAARKSFSSPPENGPAIWLVLDLAPKKRGSLERQLLALAGRLASRGVRLTYVFETAPADWLAAALAVHGVEVRQLPFRQPAAAALTFWRWLAEARPALVHFHFVRAYSPLVALARAAGARVVVHDHITLGQPADPKTPPRPPWAEAAVQGFKRARAVALNGLVDLRVAVSGFVADSVARVEHVAPERLVVVDNGIDVARFLDADGSGLRDELRAGGRPVVACVSRLAPEKGVDLLIRALARVGRDAILLVAGEGPELGRCRALAAGLGLADHVRFLGLRDDVERVYAAADVVAVPSRWDEAFGLAVVEAMAAARPVVVSASGAMPELVDHGRCGLVVKKDDAAALAGALGRLAADAGLRRRLGDAGRERARAVYGLSRWLDRMVGCYARLVPGLAGDTAPPALRSAA